MHIQGIIIGAASFAVIGFFHPIVIRTEYHIGKQAWPVFLVFGLACIAGSIYISHTIISSFIAITGFFFTLEHP